MKVLKYVPNVVAAVSSSSLPGQVVTFLQPKVASFSAHSKANA